MGSEVMNMDHYIGQFSKARFSLFVVDGFRQPKTEIEFQTVKTVALALSKIMYKKNK